MCKVSERAAITQNIIMDIRKKDTLFYTAQVLEQAYLKWIKQGFAVDVQRMLYHALDSTFTSTNDVPSKE